MNAKTKPALRNITPLKPTRNGVPRFAAIREDGKAVTFCIPPDYDRIARNIADDLAANTAAYTSGRRDYDTWHIEQIRLWNAARDADVDDEVRALVCPLEV